MKKIILIIIALICCSCSFDKTENNITTNQINNSVPIVNDYIDNNPVKVSLYVDNAKGGLTKVNEIRETWRLKRDIVVLGSIFSEKEELESDYFQNIWKNEAVNYENYEKYKTLWKVNFSLKDGTVIDQLIDHPDDVKYFYDYLELYLYDSANAQIGVWYSHLTAEDMKDNTIMTSLKLTSGSKFEEINSPIKVSVFTYDDEDDFDDEGNYRGKSISTINIYNE